MFRPQHDLDHVVRADLARLDHPQVGTGPGGLGEPLDPAGLCQPALEGAARNPRAGHLQDHVRPDPPALADQRAVDVDALSRQVLAEDSVTKRLVKLSLPEIEVLPGVGVDRLVRSAMVAHVVDSVAGQADHAQTLARAGVTITGPSTDRLSMPVSFISFHGLRRGWPTLTESSFITRRYVPPRRPGQCVCGPSAGLSYI